MSTVPPPVNYPVTYTHEGDWRTVPSRIPALWGDGNVDIGGNLTVTNNATITGTLTAGAIVVPGVPTPVCSVVKTAIQAIPDSTATTITSWSSVATGLYSTAAFNTTTGVCTIATTNYYPIIVSVAWSNSSNSGSREIRTLINGVTTHVVKAENQPNSDITLTFTQLYPTKLYLTAGTTIQFQVYQNTGGILNINAGTALVIG